MSQCAIFKRDSAWVKCDFHFSIDKNIVGGNSYYNGETKLLETRKPIILHTAGVNIAFRVFHNLYLRGGINYTQKGYGSTGEVTTYHVNHGSTATDVEGELSEVVTFTSFPFMLEYSYCNRKYFSCSFTSGVMFNHYNAQGSGTYCNNTWNVEQYYAPLAVNFRFKEAFLRFEPCFRYLGGIWSCNDNGAGSIKTYGLTFRLGL
jgi:hypothetical protein